jgi:hypothetical protein
VNEFFRQEHGCIRIDHGLFIATTQMKDHENRLGIIRERTYSYLAYPLRNCDKIVFTTASEIFSDDETFASGVLSINV